MDLKGEFGPKIAGSLAVFEGVGRQCAVSAEQVDKINSAVKACLHHCYVSPQPLATLAEFVTMLRTDPSWSENEIASFQIAVRRMLRMVKNPSDSGILPSQFRA